VSAGIMFAGIAIVRRPASVFGAFSKVMPSILVECVTFTCERAAHEVFTSLRRSPRSSARRSWHQAARNTATRKCSGMPSARACTSAMEATGRSGAFSTAAPFTWHGLREITSSSTAALMIEDRSRYALASYSDRATQKGQSPSQGRYYGAA